VSDELATGRAKPTVADGHVGVAAADAAASEEEPPPGGSLRKIGGAFGLLAIATVLGQLIGFVALAVVTRRVSASSLGAYNFDLSLATYVAIAGNFGVAYLATRDVAQRPHERYRILFDASLLVTVVLLPLSALFLVCGYVWLPEATERRVLLAVVLNVAISSLTPDWYLLARQHTRAVAAARIVGQAVYGLLVFVVIGVGMTALVRYAWFNVVGFVVTGVIVTAVVVSAWRRDQVTVDLTFAEALATLLLRMRRSLPFGYSLVVIQVYSGIAIPVLGFTVGSRQVGIYAVASRLPFALIGLATVWLSVFFPHGSAAAERDPAELRHVVGRVVSITIVAAVAIGCAAPFAARELIPLMFSHRFTAAATPFALLSIACSLVLIQATTSNVLLAVGRERLYGKLLTLVAVLMIAADVPLCRAYGATGAAIAAVGAEALIVVLTGIASRRALGGLDLEFKLIRWSLPLAAGVVLAGIGLRGGPASLLDVFVPTASGVSAAAVTGAAAWLGARARAARKVNAGPS
jgi:O-antigen/teichoic acid export membrane protein